MIQKLPSENSWLRLHRAAAFVRPYRWSVAFILGLTLALAGLQAFEPLIMKYLFDGLGTERAMHSLTLGLIGLVSLGLLREGSSAVTNWLTWRARLGVHHSLLEATVERLHVLPLSYHRSEGVGAIMTKVDRGIQGLLGAISEIAFNVLPAVLYLGISVVVMIRLEWRLALVVIVFTPLPIIIAALAAPEHIRRERSLLDHWIGIYARFNEVLSGIITVKSFAMEEEEKHRFLNDVKAANRIVVKGVGRDAGVGAAQNLTVLSAKVAAIAAGGCLVLRHGMSLGTLVAFLGYVGGLFGPVQGLSGIYKTLRTATVSLETVFSILDAQDHLIDAPDAREAPALRGEVHFDRVQFAYESTQEPVLKGIDLRIKAGEVVALVGPSGAGKSTIMALLQRLHDPLEGIISIDGLDLRSLKQRSLRRQIGVVLQEVLLFNDTIRNNIAYGKPQASMAEIMEAAKLSNAHDFILRLPEGYHTNLGERGSRLSAGERQRVAIARALLKNPPILIFDEATSALDAESEALVQEAIDRLVRGRTTFIIAHRLSTVVTADRILILRDGHIAEQGKHEELMSHGGYYASLVRKQMRGFLPLDGPRLETS